MNYKIPESVLVVIYTHELEVLLLERADRSGYWQSVTGSKAADTEDISETARREVLEETSIGAQPPHLQLKNWQWQHQYEIFEHWRHRYAPGVTHNTEHVFGLEIPRSLPIQIAPREHLQYAWLPWQEAAAKCFSPSNAEAILQLPQRMSAVKG